MAPSPVGNPRVIRNQYGAWVALVLLIGAHAAFNVTLNPIGIDVDDVSEYLAFPLMGATMAQPVLFAIWGALAAGPSPVRIPLTLAACAVVFFAGTIRRMNVFRPSDSHFSGTELTIELAIFGVSLTMMLIARQFTGWRISHLARVNARCSANQFSIKYLLVLTAICAVLLTLGRVLFAGEFESWKVVSSGLTFAGMILLTLFPLLIVPLTVIAHRPSVRALIAMPFLWMAVTWLMVEVIAAQTGEQRVDVARQVVFLQGGAAMAGLLSAIVVRCAGYRLFTSANELSTEPIESV